jgi:hypothetical protein
VLLSAWDAIAVAAADDDDDAALCWLLPSRAVAIYWREGILFVNPSHSRQRRRLCILIDRLLAKWAPSVAESREENNPYLRLKCIRLNNKALGN